jgi:hypothetical protein
LVPGAYVGIGSFLATYVSKLKAPDDKPLTYTRFLKQTKKDYRNLPQLVKGILCLRYELFFKKVSHVFNNALIIDLEQLSDVKQLMKVALNVQSWVVKVAKM